MHPLDDDDDVRIYGCVCGHLSHNVEFIWVEEEGLMHIEFTYNREGNIFRRLWETIKEIFIKNYHTPVGSVVLDSKMLKDLLPLIEKGAKWEWPNNEEAETENKKNGCPDNCSGPCCGA